MSDLWKQGARSRRAENGRTPDALHRQDGMTPAERQAADFNRRVDQVLQWARALEPGEPAHEKEDPR